PVEIEADAGLLSPHVREVFGKARLIAQAEIAPWLQRDSRNQIGGVRAEPGIGSEAVLAGKMEGFTRAHVQESAIGSEKCIKQPSIRPGTALKTVNTGEAILQEQTGGVEVE